MNRKESDVIQCKGGFQGIVREGRKIVFRGPVRTTLFEANVAFRAALKKQRREILERS